MNFAVFKFREYDDFKDKSYSFSTNYDDYPQHAVKNYILNNDGGFYYPQDYFFRLIDCGSKDFDLISFCT